VCTFRHVPSGLRVDSITCQQTMAQFRHPLDWVRGGTGGWRAVTLSGESSAVLKGARGLSLCIGAVLGIALLGFEVAQHDAIDRVEVADGGADISVSEAFTAYAHSVPTGGEHVARSIGSAFSWLWLQGPAQGEACDEECHSAE
jgi:hypothetical protein